MNQTIIDLKGKEGVTIHVLFRDVYQPFWIQVTDLSGNVLFYKRLFDKPKLKFNLPVHPDQVIMTVQGPEVVNYLVQPIKKLNIPYHFNTNLVVHRAYPITEVKSRVVPYFMMPDGTFNMSPARFLPSVGIIEYNGSVCPHLPQPVNAFVGMHELGHYFYGRDIPARFHQSLSHIYSNQLKEDEQEADRFALYNFINSGYNFSGALQSLTDYLSPSYMSMERISKMGAEIANMHQYID